MAATTNSADDIAPMNDKEDSDAAAAASLMLGSNSVIGGGVQQSPEAMAMLRAAVQAAQAVGIDPTMALAAMPLLPGLGGAPPEGLDANAAIAAAANAAASSNWAAMATGSEPAAEAQQGPPAAAADPLLPSQVQMAPPVELAVQPSAPEQSAADTPAQQQALPDLEEEEHWKQWRHLQQLQQLQQMQQQHMRMQLEQQQAQAAPQLLVQLGVGGVGGVGGVPQALAHAPAPAQLMPMAQGHHLLPQSQPAMPAPPAAQQPGGMGGASTDEFTCTVCRKVFKRAANLIFHMTEHRPAAPPQASGSGSGSGGGGGAVTVSSGGGGGGGGGGGSDGENAMVVADSMASGPSGVGPVKCSDCDKEFATKYQAKKHFLRRHFSGDKPFACTKCNKKRFVVKEDLTMHMKACGNVFCCR